MTDSLGRTSPRIEVHTDAADLATSVAGELIARLEAAQSRGEVPQIGLTGGTIAIKVHDDATLVALDVTDAGPTTTSRR